ncbi:MAG: ferrous iron transport protein B, partial [Spirochaetaceae bacterium]
MIATTSRTTTVAVVGNPNCGKTTLFNGLTGSRQRIGNWPGVTVEKKEGILNLETVGGFLAAPYLPEHHHTEEIQRAELPGPMPGPMSVTLVDLPGIYSVSASSDDERVARDFILSGEPNLVVNIVDASNLQRNLYLTVQLIEMGVPLLVVLNMVDLAEAHGISVDAERLSRELGCPVVAINATRRDGISAVRTTLAETLAETLSKPLPSPARITYPAPIEVLISGLEPACAAAAASLRADARWVALKLIEQDPHVTALVARSGADMRGLASALAPAQSALGDDLDVVVADSRYEFIHTVTSAAARTQATRESITDRIDRVVLNRFAGIPVFLLAMYVVFWVTIAVGSAFIDFFEILSGALFVDGPAALLTGVGAPSWLITMLAGGIGAGIQTVATFVPVIFMMFFMLSLLEDSGYMARAAFVMDRFMRLIGLPGKSFVPMMVGFGCTVPAIMGTRTLESTKDRYMTIAMAPFMSCGARLPV